MEIEPKSDTILCPLNQRVNYGRAISLKLYHSSRARRDFLVRDGFGVLIYFQDDQYIIAKQLKSILRMISEGQGGEWPLIAEPNKVKALSIRLVLQPHNALFRKECRDAYLLLRLADENIYISKSLHIFKGATTLMNTTMAPLINLSLIRFNDAIQEFLPSMRNRLQKAYQRYLQERIFVPNGIHSINHEGYPLLALKNGSVESEECEPTIQDYEETDQTSKREREEFDCENGDFKRRSKHICLEKSKLQYILND